MSTNIMPFSFIITKVDKDQSFLIISLHNNIATQNNWDLSTFLFIFLTNLIIPFVLMPGTLDHGIRGKVIYMLYNFMLVKAQ